MATDTHEVTDDRISVLRDQSSKLIQAEIATHNERVSLEKAVRDGVASGLSIDDASDATGLNPDEVEKITLTAEKERWDHPEAEILFGS